MARKIASNVFSFLDKASALIGKLEEQKFSQDMYCNCLELGLESPIEDMFWIACSALCKSSYITFNPGPEFDDDGGFLIGHGITVRPQEKIGSYRVDFLLTQNGIGPSEILKPVVVELDGHDFHDKDKRQRAYEKARDRYLVRNGYRVLHFTGSEVVEDPFRVAFESLELLGLSACIGTDVYDPLNPLSLAV